MGARSLPGKRFENAPFLAWSNDLSKWTEIKIIEHFRESFDNILIARESKTLVSWQGKIIELDTAGNWKSLDDIDRIRPDQIGISGLGASGGKLFLFGSTGGREGQWTPVFSNDRSTNRWKRYRLNNVLLNNLMVLSSEQLLACGSITSSDRSDSHQVTNGVILHSFDGGSTWLISHRSSVTERFNDMVSDDRGLIWAIGEKGVMLKLEKLD